jgi:hypothetical protein
MAGREATSRQRCCHTLTSDQFSRLAEASRDIDASPALTTGKIVSMDGNLVLAVGTGVMDDIANPINKVRILRCGVLSNSNMDATALDGHPRAPMRRWWRVLLYLWKLHQFRRQVERGSDYSGAYARLSPHGRGQERRSASGLPARIAMTVPNSTPQRSLAHEALESNQSCGCSYRIEKVFCAQPHYRECNYAI